MSHKREQHLPVLMLDDELLRLCSGLGKASLCHLATLFEAPIQQQALVGLEQLQLMGLLQLLLPEPTDPSKPAAVRRADDRGTFIT